jgi:decaprenylphospho-beta-D-ribofuranose 2-oxidase
MFRGGREVTPVPRRLTGWGRNVASSATLLAMTGPDDVADQICASAPGGVLARGLGRAYGDAALNAGGTLLALRDQDLAPRIDAERAVVSVGAGISVGLLLQDLLPRGLMLPVVPGTRHVTVGGAIAADIHGKNHHQDSSFGAWVDEISLVDGTGQFWQLTPTRQPELFWATVGGMGLTGVITAATLRLRRVETSWINLVSTRIANLDDLFARLATGPGPRYQVAWVDCLGRGPNRYRAVLDEADHAALDDLPASVSSPTETRWRGSLPAPPTPVNPLRRPVCRALNGMWWHKAPTHRADVVPMQDFFFPLDRVSSWNRFYGPHGLVQYQFVVPPAATEVVRSILDLLLEGGQTPSLTVLKRMGEATPAPLSFPIPGWTAAVDLPDTGHLLIDVLAEADRLVSEAGGRVYLAKDSRSRPESVPAMYGRLTEWQASRAQLDPSGRFASDLSRRTRLC